MKKTALIVLSLASLCSAAPEGGEVRAGSATINGNTVRQHTEKAIIDWQRFNVDANELVRFVQPSQAAVLLNRVVGSDPSLILGRLQANGQIFLVNPNGILFGPGSQVDVGSLVATTLSLTDENFLSGNYQLTGEPNLASVVNQGTIHVTDGGYVVLTAPLVSNEGLIVANLGKVALGAGNQAVLNLDGRDLVSFQLSSAPGGGGTVVLTPEAVSTVLKGVVNDGQLVPAGSLVEEGGRVHLVGAEGTLVQAGTLQAGSVQTDAGQVTVLSSGSVTTAGQADILGRNVDVSGAVTASTVNIGRNARVTRVQADADVQAQDSLVVWSDERTEIYGSLEALGGLVETSSKQDLVMQGQVSVGSGTWLIDPANLTIVNHTAGVNEVYNVDINFVLDTGGSVFIDARNASGSDVGNIFQNGNAPITKSSGGAAFLDFRAGTNGSVTLNAPITSTFGDLDITVEGGSGTVQLNSTITTNNGNFNSGGTGAFQMTSGSSLAVGTDSLTVIHTGAVTVSTVSGDSVWLESTGAAVNSDGTPGDTATATSSLTLRGATGVGDLSTFRTNTPMLETILSGSGNVDISNSKTGLLTLSASTADGDLKINQPNGALDVTSAVAGGSLGDIRLDANNDIRINSAVAQGNNVTIISALGSINELGSDPQPEVTANLADLYSSGNGAGGIGTTGIFHVSLNLLYTANYDSTSLGGVHIQDDFGGLRVVESQSNSGTLELVAQNGLLQVDQAQAGTPNPNVDLLLRTLGSSGDISAWNVTATGTATLQAVGQILDDLDNLPDISSQTGVVLQAGKGIDAHVFGNAPLTASVSGVGPLDVHSSGNLDVTSATTFDGLIRLSADGGQLTVHDAIANGTGRHITLTTSGAGANDVVVDNVQAAGDTISISATQAIQEFGSDATADLVGNRVGLVSVAGVGASDTLEVEANIIPNVGSSGPGSIDVLDLAGGVVVTNATTSDGFITLGANGGGLTVENAIVGGPGRNLTATNTGAGDLLLGRVTASGDSVLLNSFGRVLESGSDPEAEVTAGILDVTSKGLGDAGVTVETQVNRLRASVSGTGRILLKDLDGLQVDNASATGGNVNLTATGLMSAYNVQSSGTVTLTTSGAGNLQVDSVQGTSATLSAFGNVNEVNPDTTADVIAPTLTMTAGTGIGVGGTVEIDANTLVANVTGAGAIDLDDRSGSGTLLDITATTANGAVTISGRGGSLRATNINAAGNVNLTTNTTGNVVVGLLQSTGAVNLTAADHLVELGDDAGMDIVAAQNSTLSAGGWIGTGSISLDVQITSNSLSVFAGQATGGGVSINLAGTVGGSTSPTGHLIHLNTPPGTSTFNGISF